MPADSHPISPYHQLHAMLAVWIGAPADGIVVAARFLYAFAGLIFLRLCRAALCIQIGAIHAHKLAVPLYSVGADTGRCVLLGGREQCGDS
jgi:hypothetical protein